MKGKLLDETMNHAMSSTKVTCSIYKKSSANKIAFTINLYNYFVTRPKER